MKRPLPALVACAPRRLLQVNKLYPPDLGGIENVVRDIAEGLNARGSVKVTVLASRPRGRGGLEVQNGVPVHRASSVGMALGMPLSPDFVLRFKRLVGANDLILLHHPFPLGFVAARLAGNTRPVAVWYHSDIVRQRITNGLLKGLWHAVLGRAARIFVSNQHLADSSKLLRRYKVKCVAVPFGVDLRRFQKTSEVQSAADAIRQRYAAPLVLAVGRLVYYKGFEYLIEAMKWVEATLLIVGAGPLRAHLDALAAAHGVSRRVHILDPVSIVSPYYHACDVFVLPSVEPSEAFGVVQIEAMACGKPVINTALPTAVPDVSVDGETGFTVPARDSRALADAINGLLGDQALRARLGSNARQRAGAHFSLERFLSSVESELIALRALA